MPEVHFTSELAILNYCRYVIINMEPDFALSGVPSPAFRLVSPQWSSIWCPIKINMPMAAFNRLSSLLTLSSQTLSKFVRMTQRSQRTTTPSQWRDFPKMAAWIEPTDMSIHQRAEELNNPHWIHIKCLHWNFYFSYHSNLLFRVKNGTNADVPGLSNEYK